eukprot:1528018-Prymnesium_polylepis.1
MSGQMPGQSSGQCQVNGQVKCIGRWRTQKPTEAERGGLGQGSKTAKGAGAAQCTNLDSRDVCAEVGAGGGFDAETLEQRPHAIGLAQRDAREEHSVSTTTQRSMCVSVGIVRICSSGCVAKWWTIRVLSSSSVPIRTCSFAHALMWASHLM